MKRALIVVGIVLGASAAAVLIWPGILLIPEYLFVWIMNGGRP